MIIEYIQAYPRTGILVIALLVSLFVTLVNYFILDKERMRELKALQKEINLKIKEEKDPQKKIVLTNEMMKHSMETMRHSMKPMLITFVPMILVLGLIRKTFTETAIAHTWIWYYLAGAIIGSVIFRKLFRLP